jgi:tetratricopeptide (TPR) repeat protein
VPHYLLLLNERLKTHIQALGAREKQRLREKLEFLEAGLWDSGLRVKKLKNPDRRVVFEARVSKSERLLFTLGKRGDRTAVYLWGLVGHDDVSQAARSVLPDNAPFLDFEPEAVEDYPEALLDDLPADYFQPESVDDHAPEEHGPQKWLILNDRQWQRLLQASASDHLDIFLFLTREQAEILKAPPPLLLSGTAGSGKTTISVYYLLRKGFRDKKRLFLTFSPFLRDFSERIYAGLAAKTGFDEAAPPQFRVFRELLQEIVGSAGQAFPPEKEVGFREFQRLYRKHRLYQKYDAELVWEEIRSMIKGAKPSIALDRLKKTLPDYANGSAGRETVAELRDFLLGVQALEAIGSVEDFLRRKTRYAGVEELARDLGRPAVLRPDQGAQILAEIAKICAKRAGSLAAPLLTYPEYVRLGRKRAPIFMYERKDIYDIAEYYQRELDSRGWWDDIDLCRQAVGVLTRRPRVLPYYDLLVCDEVQDFADIQLALIFSLVPSPANVVLTGDPKQIINPSGFRWEEVRNKFYERGVAVPEVRHLRLNFRCVGSIVRLANALLDLKRQLVGLAGSELREEWKFSGRPPFVLSGLAEADILERMPLKGAGRIVLVRDRREQKRLKAALGSELVFTIQEAKGLEFDTVFLWKFTGGDGSRDLWRAIREGGEFDRSRQPHVRHELNLLYVAVTRARNALIIYDAAEDVWAHPLLREHIYRSAEKEVLSEIWQRVSTPAEWARQGDYFFERQYYPAAAECYKNANRSERAEEALALALYQKQDYTRAAALLLKHGHIREAAVCWEHTGRWREAQDLWERLGEASRAVDCRIRGYEQSGQFDHAAEEWARQGEMERAAENWKKSGNHRRLAAYHETRGDWELAAAAHERAGELLPAAAAYQKAGRRELAADLYVRGGGFAAAVPLLKKLKRTRPLLDCYIGLKDFYQAGLLCEKEGRLKEAIDHFKTFAAESAENRQRLEADLTAIGRSRAGLKSAVRWSALAAYDRSAPIFSRRKLYDLAIADYRSAGELEAASDCCLAKGDCLAAARLYEESGDPDKWKRVEELMSRHFILAGGRDPRMAARLREEADGFARQGELQRALVRFKVIFAFDRVLELCLAQQRDEEALEYFVDDDRLDFAGRYLQQRPALDLSDDFLRRLLKRYDRYDRRRPEDAFVEFLLRIFRGCLQARRDPWLLEQARQLLDSLQYVFGFEQTIGGAFVDLVAAAGHYNLLADMVSMQRLLGRRSRKTIEASAANIRRKAEALPDDHLMACALLAEDEAALDGFLDRLQPDADNFKLFANSRRHYGRAVDELQRLQRFEEAAYVCRRHGDLRLAAQILEDAGQPEAAAKAYVDGKLYAEALRCYSDQGNQVGMARVLERMKQWEKALEIWRRLGRSRDVARLQKKMQKSLPAKGQLDLF